jgi:poly(A) polymerase
MLKKLYGYFSNKKSLAQLQVIPREDHNISRRNISHSALKVIQRLNQSGYESYLVGGGVRDLQLGGRPKDFDVATSATPEQVKQIFRNSRIIGRRFKIVHVRFGREIIEVTTFRAHHDANTDKDQPSSDSARSDSGMLLRDNVYGDIVSDACRRDFTINALYYTTNNFCIHDYTNGMDDLQQQKIRMIGNPAERYKEDPVRMLRAIRFAAKLNFSIEPATEKPIAQLRSLLTNIPSARLFDESLKMFMGGYSLACLQQLDKYKLLEFLSPPAATAMVNQASARSFFERTMRNTDKRLANDLRVTPAYIYAALLWPAVCAEESHLITKGEHPARALQLAAQHVIGKQVKHTAIPKRFTQSMREIWELQFRLLNPRGQQFFTLVEHPRFRAAYDFLLMREENGENLNNMGVWWTNFQSANEEERQVMATNFTTKSKPQKTKRRRSNHQKSPAKN